MVRYLSRMTTPRDPLYAGYRYPAELISYAVWLYFRFPLSLRMVGETLAARGILVTYETIRQWGLKFGQEFANRLCQLVGLTLRWHATRAVDSQLRRSGEGGDLGPNLKGLGPGGSIMVGWNSDGGGAGRGC